jgi:TatD DNase family protein
MVTFKRWDGAAYVRACPADRLLVETDAPYLAPVPHRGKRNEPAFVAQVAARIAELRDMSEADVARRTTENAVSCFGSRITLGAEDPA